MEDLVASIIDQYCHHSGCDNTFRVTMDNTTEKRRHELEKYFDPKGPFAALRVSQMKRAWKQENRRELNFWENTYLPMLFSGIYLTSKHFFYNVTFHILHLFGIAKEYQGCCHLSISGNAPAFIVTFKDPPSPDQARGRFSQMRGLHDVRDRMPGQVHRDHRRGTSGP